MPSKTWVWVETSWLRWCIEQVFWWRPVLLLMLMVHVAGERVLAGCGGEHCSYY